MKTRKIPELKQKFAERMQILLPEKKDFEKYLQILKEPLLNSIRCNKLKISPEELKSKLEKNKWKIEQPFSEYPEIMIVQGKYSGDKIIPLEPGELGRALEHILGYYYVQEIASMLPIIALNLNPEEIFLDLCAAPGSKTTQAASDMKNTGTIIANEMSLPRIKILASNLERCGVANTIVTKKEGASMCKKLKDKKIKIEKILVDAPCSGEGTLRSSLKTYLMWNLNSINSLSKTQKQLFESAFEILEVGGEIVYSTCTHAPEENEEVVNYALEKFKGKIKIEMPELPKEIKFRKGITSWNGKTYLPEVELACRIYPQDNDTEGFFLAKFRRIK